MNDSNQNQALDHLSEQLSEWRKTHHAPARIPAAIWSSAVSLAGSLGVCRVSRSLRLDYASLKKRIAKSSVPAIAAAEPNFVEWLPALSGNISECSLELQDRRGSKVVVQMKNISTPSLVSVLRDLVN